MSPSSIPNYPGSRNTIQSYQPPVAWRDRGTSQVDFTHSIRFIHNNEISRWYQIKNNDSVGNSFNIYLLAGQNLIGEFSNILRYDPTTGSTSACEEGDLTIGE